MNFYGILMVVDVLLAIGLIGLILLQHGKGADAGAAFGSGASATVFGAQGSTSFLSRLTAILAALFFVNSLGLAYIASHQTGPSSITDALAAEQIQTDGGIENAESDIPTDSTGFEASEQPDDVPQSD